MKYIIITILLSIFVGYSILAQEEITDADVHYTVLGIYEDHILNQMSVTYTEHYEWEGTYQGVTMTARVE
jgi:hypothetical protein